jgi:hypothetical protein
VKKHGIIVTGILTTLLIGAAAGVAADRLIAAAARSHILTDEFRMSVSVTAAGDPARPVRLIQDRDVFNVPAHYGNLVNITTEGNRTILWYNNNQHRLRNLIIEGAGEKLVAIQIMPVTDLRVEASR